MVNSNTVSILVTGNGNNQCILPNVQIGTNGLCPEGFTPISGTSCCQPISPTLRVSVKSSTLVVNSGQIITVTGNMSPNMSGIPITFYANGNEIGTSYTDSSGIATYNTSFTNNSSSSIQEVLSATALINGSTVNSSNGVSLTVTGIAQANNYGLACTRSGFWICEAGFGSYSETECNNIYQSKIGTSCR